MYFMNHHILSWLCAVASLVCILCAQSASALQLAQNFTGEIIEMKTHTDFGLATVFIFIAYTFQYIMTAGIFEITHPNGALSKEISEKQRLARQEQVMDELRLGIVAMFSNVVITMFWMAYVDPLMWTYKYFDKHEYNIWWFLTSIPAYLFFFDTWFYITHRWLHESQWAWDQVHRIHHGFKHPSAFAQDATHPIEAAIQGPFGHYMVTLFFPIHPVAHALFGFLSSIFAIAAHDGRAGDLNSHYCHHDKGRGKNVNFNYGLYWPLCDNLFGTRWTPTKDNIKKLDEEAPETWKPAAERVKVE
eukprot:m.340190 g.340190  ORF g.340190 m.340190 type:complete len:303 (+) comp19172_c0_seq1:145-1053(+)